eukprot:TRINITY_DN1281_c0_g1_i1.p1 TRINITY_DN1281_c0_g1~~TRINITY_DN1281_c0_g1_i1.p1  ORF type:complete len:143 (+),score=20.27 TRINITY_DN1281_c0_g1_i1:83-511(+)
MHRIIGLILLLSLCDPSHQICQELRRDCHSFYDCRTQHVLTCGYLMFNPLLGVCDWPGRVLRIRPECSTSNASSAPYTAPKARRLKNCAQDFIQCIQIAKSLQGSGVLLPVIREKSCQYTFQVCSGRKILLSELYFLDPSIV